jgi:tetratricopeptide (TPR) repeat protein
VNPAAVVAEGAAKPDLGMQLTEQIVKPVKIAAIAGVTMEALQDYESFVNWIPLELTRALINAEIALVASGLDTHAFARASLVMALAIVGSYEEARAAATGLVECAEATRNPYVLSNALQAYGLAFRDTDPVRALDALRRGLAIAHDCGARASKSYLAQTLARLEAEHGDPLAVLDYFSLAIRSIRDSGNVVIIRSPLAILAAFLARLGRHEAAATIAGFVFSPFTAAVTPEITTAIADLRDVLGNQIYESLARSGETMTMAAVATYAYDEIDQVRAALKAVLK